MKAPLWRQVTDAIVNHLFEMMQNPKYRGEKFDEATFDIAGHVIGTGMMSFRRLPTQRVQRKMRLRADERWAELCKGKK
jgi:hypothetical protein